MTEHPIPVAITVLGVSLMAQVTDMPATPGLPGIVSTMGVVGALIWHMWFVSAKLVPRMQDKFNDTLEKMRLAFAEEQRSMRTEHARQMAEVREEHRARMAAEKVPKTATGE